MDQNITTITQSEQFSLYQLTTKSPLRIFLFSTEETRTIVNNPLLLGVEYTQKLQAGIEQFLAGYKELWPYEITAEHTNVAHFLRGGLNFGLREALANAYGFNTHNCSYLSSQRAVDAKGRWFIQEDSYEKITVGKGSAIFIGDVVATGVTLDHSLKRLTETVKARKGSIRHLVFFTIGCHKTEKILEKYYEVWKNTFADFESIDIVYIEGKFHLADTKTPVSIKILGTDLLRRDCILTPECIESQNSNITYPLERCAIYDAGSRAFHIPEYLGDVREYWEQNLKLAQSGTTTLQLLDERYPEASKQLKKIADQTDLATLCEEYIQKINST